MPFLIFPLHVDSTRLGQGPDALSSPLRLPHHAPDSCSHALQPSPQGDPRETLPAPKSHHLHLPQCQPSYQCGPRVVCLGIPWLMPAPAACISPGLPSEGSPLDLSDHAHISSSQIAKMDLRALGLCLLQPQSSCQGIPGTTCSGNF